MYNPPEVLEYVEKTASTNVDAEFVLKHVRSYLRAVLQSPPSGVYEWDTTYIVAEKHIVELLDEIEPVINELNDNSKLLSN